MLIYKENLNTKAHFSLFLGEFMIFILTAPQMAKIPLAKQQLVRVQ
jgi:hypothetical protein